MNDNLFDVKYLDIRQDGFISLNYEWDITFINPVAANLIGYNKNQFAGGNFWEAVPAIIGSELETAYRSVMNDKMVRRIEINATASGRWFNNIIFPTASGLSIYIQDITKEKKNEEALLQNEQKLKFLVENLNYMDQSKTAFISTLSHELRNPMASIMLGASLLRQDPLVGKVSGKAIDIIERQSVQLNNLVNDLLDVTRINQNKISLNKERIELNRLMNRIFEDYEDRFRKKGIDTEIEYGTEPLYLNLDVARFNQILSNLLENSLKFTEPGGKLLLSCRQDSAKTNAVIKLTDTGIGIKPEIQKQLFKPFVQADLSLDHSYGGLGLGLVIVKGLVEMHDGSISLYSEGVGKGTEMEITLPLLAESGVMPDDKKVEAEDSSTPVLNLLVIDDVPDLTEILSEVLSNLGHQVTVANEGNSGILLAKKNRPDVLLCDIGLPYMNGYEIAEAFNKDPELKKTFLIALSGYAQPDDIERSKQAGFHLHLSKPANLEELKTALAEAFYYTNKKR